MTDKAFTTCLWFDTQGEEAASFYAGVFPDSKIGSITRYGEAGPGPAGAVMTVEFELNGQKFLALNGGPQYEFNEAFSLMIPCADQAEVDYYWDRLSAGGKEIACGWVKDKFGLCWQVVPTVLPDLIGDRDPVKASRAMAAMMSMTKFDIAALQGAHAGE